MIIIPLQAIEREIPGMSFARIQEIADIMAERTAKKLNCDVEAEYVLEGSRDLPEDVDFNPLEWAESDDEGPIWHRHALPAGWGGLW